LYTFKGDLVLDPFLGSGSTAIAAAQTGRHFVGYETDPEYAALAENRIASARAGHRATLS
jgi:site-specific DNA-methyltransferase (adenine-specific)